MIPYDVVEIYNLQNESTIDVAGGNGNIVGALPRVGENIDIRDVNGVVWSFTVKSVVHQYYEPSEYVPNYIGTRVFLSKITLYCEEFGR